MIRLRSWPWLLLPALLFAGIARLHLDVEILNLLPPGLAPVQGLKIFQEHFANARELIVAVRAPNAETAEDAARAIADELRAATNRVAQVTWQAPWLEHPGQTAEFIASLWFNQPPELFAQLTNRLAPDQAGRSLAAARDQLATSLSPGDIGRLGYDPFGLAELPAGVSGAAPAFGQGSELFAAGDGTFRIVFVQAAGELATYRDCARWLQSVKELVARAAGRVGRGVTVAYTGRPAFAAEISGSMQRDMMISVGATALIIAGLFWLAHRRLKPMLWLLTLLALILAGTLALGGLVFGTINVVSMGFAAILLGLAVDYAVVHYQEAMACPGLSVPEVRRAIAPGIFWAAITTISAFLVLNFGGLPGLAQLGSLVGIGVALSAVVMIFAFLPPLFPERMERRSPNRPVVMGNPDRADSEIGAPLAGVAAFAATALLILVAMFVLRSGLPGLDATPNALRPRRSPAYTTLEAIQEQFQQQREPLWLVLGGRDEREIAARLDEVEPSLNDAVSNRLLSGFTLPTALWPRPERQAMNRAVALQLSAAGGRLREAALAAGFTSNALAFTDGVLATWQLAATAPNTFWPTNGMSRWIFEKFAARGPTNVYALGLLYPSTHSPGAAALDLASLAAKLPRDHAWLSGWELLGRSILDGVRGNLWKLTAPMLGLVLLSLCLAFRRPAEVLLSLGALALGGLCLLAIMRVAGWSWNLLNLMALPLILGTGVDYGIFMQLALRRHGGDLGMAHRSVGRALLLCGGTAVSGFGALGFSSNAGMAGLGRVCAAGIAANMLIAVFLLPVWWKKLCGARAAARLSTLNSQHSTPSTLYRASLWRLGLWLVRRLPRRLCLALGRALAGIYWTVAAHRREVVIANLLPALQNDPAAARRKARSLFDQFAIKIVDLWRYEAGLQVHELFGNATGWEHLQGALALKRGVLLLTPHLGNWEFGGPWLIGKGVPLQVVTLAEPGDGFTQLRLASRARWNIETLVIGNDPFVFVELIRRLEAGAVIALLIDRPPPATAVNVELFGRPFAASIAAAELARASGCVLLPVWLPLENGTYSAHVLPPLAYERAGLRDPAVRRELTQKIIRAFEPAIREHPDQWYHFIPIWPK